MIRIVFGLILTGATFYTAILYKSTSLALLGYAEIVLLVSAVLFLVYRMFTVSCSIQIPISIAECERPHTVRICVENKSPLPCAKLKYCLERGSRLMKKRRRKWIRGWAAQPGRNTYDYQMVFKNYGSYEVGIRKVRIYDLTGLFYIQQKPQSRGYIQTFPRMQEIGVHLTESVRNYYGDSDIYDDFRPGHDRSELFQIRPFQNGDKIQSIHWKISAKMDELLVREDSLPKACPVVLLLDYRQGKQKDEKKLNAYFVILASISFSMMDAGCPHYIAWYSSRNADVVRVRVDDEESLYLFLCCYMEEAYQEQTGHLLEAYQEKYRGEQYLYMLQLQFDNKLQLRKNQEQIMSFTAKDWEEKLDGLELVL